MTTILRIGAAPQAFAGHGLYLDGDTSAPQRAELAIDEDSGALTLTIGTDAPLLWPLAEIRHLRDQADRDIAMLRLASDPLARLVLTELSDQAIIAARAPNLDKAPPVEGKRRLAIWGGAAIGAVVVMIFLLIPLLANSLAALLPAAGQRALGETVFEDIRGALDTTGLNPIEICEAPDGLAALDIMRTRLFPDGLEDVEMAVFVLDHPMVNAFALPGGIVVLMRGLIEAAETPEEVAAVYAHEVGHVVARDPARIALRTTGSVGVLGLLLGDFAGGAVVLFLSNQLIRADYTQEAEAAADAFAHAKMRAAELPPEALATLFERLRSENGEAPALIEHFMAHPSLGDRIEAARSAGDPGASFRPVLNASEWAALRGVCDSA